MEKNSSDDPIVLTKNIIEGIRKSAQITAARTASRNSYSKIAQIPEAYFKDRWLIPSDLGEQTIMFWDGKKIGSTTSFHTHPSEANHQSPQEPRVEDEVDRPHNEAMTSVSREELDAKLEVLRSDLRAGNADLRSEFHAMRADVAGIRTAINQDLSAVVSSMGDLKGAAGEVKGSLDGVKTSLTTVQWLVGTLLAAAALYVAIAQLSAPATPTQPAQQAPIIINVPGGATPATPAVPASR